MNYPNIAIRRVIACDQRSAGASMANDNATTTPAAARSCSATRSSSSGWSEALPCH